MLLGGPRHHCFPSVLLHPPPLASEMRASYGEMSRRSGAAAKEDSHSDISPFRINDLRAVSIRLSHMPTLVPNADAITFVLSELNGDDEGGLGRNCVRPLDVVRSL